TNAGAAISRARHGQRPQDPICARTAVIDAAAAFLHQSCVLTPQPAIPRLSVALARPFPQSLSISPARHRPLCFPRLIAASALTSSRPSPLAAPIPCRRRLLTAHASMCGRRPVEKNSPYPDPPPLPSTRSPPAFALGAPPQYRRLRTAVTAADAHSRLHSIEPAQARSHHRYRHMNVARGRRRPRSLREHIRHLPPSSSPPSPTLTPS
ncbi:hypothetical protein HYPSUDRAFT_209945, partial [Hypholoma sublateritium FD-334 SS-4]